jgi:signal transduction histidine kinase
VIAGYTLFAFSMFPLALTPLLAIDIQGLTKIMQAIAMFLIFTSLAKPFEEKGVAKSTTLGLTAFLFFVPAMPFIMTQVIGQWFSAFYADEFGAFAITHLSAGLISAVMALLLYLNSRSKTDLHLFPLSLVFVTWSVTEFFHFFYSQTETILVYGETFSPYIIGSIFTSIILIRLIQILHARIKPLAVSKLKIVFLAYILLLVLSLILGEVIQWAAFGSIEGLIDEPVGDVITIVINIIVMMELAYLAYLVFEENNFQLSIDLMGLGTLSLWIVPSILKRLFEDWSAGFWAAELFLLFAVALGPAMLGILYVYTSVRETTLREEADLFADLLMHDIGNYLQALLISVDLVGDDQTDVLMKEMALRDARDVIIRGENLVRNVRRLTQKSHSPTSQLHPIELINQIHLAFQQTIQTTSSEEVALTVRTAESSAFVHANKSLIDVFVNLLSNSIMYSDDKKQIEVQVDSFEVNNSQYWRTKVIDYGKGISNNLREDLLSSSSVKGKRSGLGIAVAKQLVDSFKGFMRIESRVPDDYTKGTVVEVYLLKAEN